METTYLVMYGVCNSYLDDEFVSLSKLVKKEWATNPDGTYVKLGGYWRDSGTTAIYENYFVVTHINERQLDASASLNQELTNICRAAMSNKWSDYATNIVYFASDSSLGYEYPAISKDEESNISSSLDDVFDYRKILRYAFASRYAYFLDDPEQFPFKDNPAFRELMTNTEGQLEIIDQIVGDEAGIYAVAIKAPQIGADLEEEIIISYKGTSNKWDVWEDVRLSFQNFFESDTDWQKGAFDFFSQVVAQYPPKNSCIQDGYKLVNGKHSVVLTGHSLGGYTAIQTGVRTGLVTRAFSSPATKIIDKYVNFFSNTLYRNCAVNFVRNSDPVVYGSGRHSENMVYFAEPNTIVPFSSHYLNPFIQEILLPLAQSPNLDLNPTSMYITPDVLLGAGINKPINKWSNVVVQN